jgi:hypothetical protein
MRAGYRDLSIRVTSSFVLMGCSCSTALCGQLVRPDTPPSGLVRIETTPLPASAARKIMEIPLPVDINLAKQFVKLGFGPVILGEVGFQSTEFLTPVLSTRQAAELVLLVPEYGPFKGDAVAEGILKFAGRVSGVAFGREL